MMAALKSFDLWVYIMIIGILLVVASASALGNGKDRKMRRLGVKFNKQDSIAKTLTGRPLKLSGGRAKPILLIIGVVLCLTVYFAIIIKRNVMAYAGTEPLIGGLFLIAIIILLAAVVITVCIFLTKLLVYENALVKKNPLQRKIYYFNDFDELEISAYADAKISYHAFAVTKDKTMLKLWLRKPAHFEALQAFFKEDPNVAEITKDRLDTPYYTRLKARENG